MLIMKVLSWNARMLNSPKKQCLLKKKVQKEQPDIAVFHETKCSSNTMVNISKKLGKQIDYLETTSNGWEGGMAILWNPRVIQLISS